MHTVDDITAEIIRREGGYVNDPDDPGGATNHGVTIHTLRRLRGTATVADVKALTVAEAKDIYKRHYFYGPKIDQLPAPLQASVYDMQVNAGANAVKILQRLLAEFDNPLTVDGALGPRTLKAVKRVHDEAGAYLVDAYGIARRNYYFDLADRRPVSRKYALSRAGGKGGWIKRAEEFMAPGYCLMEAQFSEKVSQWV